MLHIGKLVHLNRYPVKSFAGEALDRVEIANYGLYGDRSYAFMDETKTDWDAYITARQIPQMLAYRAEMSGKGTADQFPDVLVTAPAGHTRGWDEQLLSEIQAYTKIKLSMSRCHPTATDQLAVDIGSILIITDASLRELEKLWGKRLDPRRFRANMIIAMREGVGWKENDLIGKQLHVGNVILHIDSWCERCAMIAIDPDTLERDTSLLRVINERMDLKYGVYASVIKTGEISVGEKVFVAGE